MGTDKALLSISGRTMLEVIAERVSLVANDVFVVADDGDKYVEFGLRVVPDVIRGAGSLGGIFSALLQAKHDVCLVVACDMPLLNVELLRYLVESLGQYDVVIPSLAAGRSDQSAYETLDTMHAVYRKSALPALEQRIRAGEFKIATALQNLDLLRVPEETIRRLDPQLLSLFNVNTPEDYEFARSILEDRHDDQR